MATAGLDWLHCIATEGQLCARQACREYRIPDDVLRQLDCFAPAMLLPLSNED